MICITGDMHREFYRLCGVEPNSMLIILGDASINYYLDIFDNILKDFLSCYNIKLFCIQGNHEERPENIPTYKEVEMFGGKVFIESAYPNLIFAKNGELYNIDNKKVLVIGGAYSIDKDNRIMKGIPWFKDEQLTKKEMDDILIKYKGKHIDVILSHTCPLKYEPTEAFIEGVEQLNVDKSMEMFLDRVEEVVDYDKWYCGHYHIEKQVAKIEFMFKNIKKFNKDIVVFRENYLDYEVVTETIDKKSLKILKL